MVCRWKFRKPRILLFTMCMLIPTVLYLITHRGIEEEENKQSLKYQEPENKVWTFDAEAYIRKKINFLENPYSKHAFNIRISDGIPVDRDVPDSRDPRCGKVMLARFVDNSLVSVVISYHNEARSTLLRTIVSILNRSPENLLQEIILVDDHSDDASDGEELSKLPKVKILRNSEREGLIRSRAFGADIAKSDYLIFLDSHCEVNVGWIEALIDVVIQNPKAIVSPVIDVIDMDTFEYKGSAGELKGGFDWGLNFHWQQLSEKERSDGDSRSQPFKSPSLPGGMFIVKKSWFTQIGGFDKGLEIWGAENIELSLKTWLCGGQVIVQPCSRVGHVFRKRHPYTFPNNGSSIVYLKNTRRIAEVWLDEYQHEFFDAVPKARKEIINQLEDQLKIKRNLKCKPFKWFLNEIYPELKPLVKDILAFGQIRQGDFCLQSSDKAKGNFSAFSFRDCMIGSQKQEWSFTKTGTLELSNSCLTANIRNFPQVTLRRCSNNSDQIWVRKRRLLIHKQSDLCLESSTRFDNPTLLVLSPCYRRVYTQQWDFTMELQSMG